MAELVVGAIAGALAQIFTIPVSVIATRQQVGRADDEGSADNSFTTVAREIIDEDGVKGLWLGLRPGLVLTVNPAITYGSFERIKSIVLLARGATKMGPWLSFVVGALSKTLATVVSDIAQPLKTTADFRQVTYPYIMAKVRIQAGFADEVDDAEQTDQSSQSHRNRHKHRKHPGALKILMAVWKDEGFSGWYQVCAVPESSHSPKSLSYIQGMQAQITKAVLSQALLFMSKEQFEHWALAIMIIFAKLISRRRIFRA